MAKAPVKKAATKKTAPVRKKAVAKKTAPVRKKAVTKKAAPVRKKAVAKKAAPIRKKAVAKKAAPVRQVKNREIDLDIPVYGSSTEKIQIQREQELPKFLKDIETEKKIPPIPTQGYTKKKSRKPLVVLSISVLALAGLSAFAISYQPSSDTKKTSTKVNLVANQEPAANNSTPSPNASQGVSSGTSKNLAVKSLAPRNFASLSDNQSIDFTWLAPIDPSSVIGYELSVKKSGASSWTVISSVTTHQLLVSVDLESMESTSQYRIASLLDNGKMAFSKVVLNVAGVVA
jgi:hypothetical protein